VIAKLFRLWPQPWLLARLYALSAVQAILQGLLLGALVPILTPLLAPVPDFDAALPWLIAGGVGLVLYWVLCVIATPVGFAASMDLAAQLRHHLMRHVRTLPLGWFTGPNKARLARAITADCSHAAQLAVTIGVPAITCALVPATILVVTVFLDWRLALLFLAIAPLSFLTLRHAGEVAGRADVELEAANAEIAGRAIELGQAQTVLRAAGRAASGSARLREALAEHKIVYRRGLGRSMIPDLVFTSVVMGGFVAALVVGGTLLLDGDTPVVSAIALLILAVRFLEPIGHLIELIGALRAMDNAIARLQAILGTPALPTPAKPVTTLASGEIVFDDVSFSYGAKPVLRNVSLRCRPGAVTALVGPSGSGKSTIIRLIARFFDVADGAVRIGGIDVRDIDPDVLMGDVAIIFQDVYLFDDTIEENLRFARPGASAADLAAAAKAARLDELIERLPDGWATRVGEGGAMLSGGERQRVSIARAFLKGSRIVLIDEASSALDPENEAAVSQAIAALSADPARTVIVIAHRPATLGSADHVIVLRDGEVAESGAPALLLDNDGPFSRIYRQYEAAREWTLATSPGDGDDLSKALT
jgi:ATP-binding cassette subfamily B protein